MKTVLITGAAGNLGGLLSEYLKDCEVQLNLMVHKKPLKSGIEKLPNVKIFKADLHDPDSLDLPLQNVDVVVHFAGVLFKHNPEKFLPVTNVIYFKNLLTKCIEHQVKRVILISFPHVEGETTPDNPATGRLDASPTSIHAKTRLEEEKLLIKLCNGTVTEPVSLRVGMVYGRGILMIDGARWFAKYFMLGVWEKPTWIHLISTIDYLEANKQAIFKDNIKGIYHIGDEGVQTLQQFLDDATHHWGYKKPWRMPVGLIMAAAGMFEFFSKVFNIRSPLTRDFIRIGLPSYYGDTSRMRKELLPVLKYKTYKDGIHTL